MKTKDQNFNLFLKKVGRNIRKYRLESGLSQEDMDNDNDAIDYKFYQRIEYGEKNITLKTLFKISKKLNIEPYKLLENFDKDD